MATAKPLHFVIVAATREKRASGYRVARKAARPRKSAKLKKGLDLLFLLPHSYFFSAVFGEPRKLGLYQDKRKKKAPPAGETFPRLKG